MKNSNEKRLFYDTLGADFDSVMNKYDLTKRLALVFNRFLSEKEITNKRLLDAGCGPGWFSALAADLGAKVISLDISKNLLDRIREKSRSPVVVLGDMLSLPFLEESFDIVVSSEAIEHTVDPRKSIVQLHRVLRTDGILILTTPNRIWHPAVSFANSLNLRPYKGYENWMGWNELKSLLTELNFKIEEMIGFHIIPFFSPKIYNLLDYFDRWGKQLGPVMLNIGVKARRH